MSGGGVDGWFSDQVPVRLRERASTLASATAIGPPPAAEGLLRVAVEATRRLLEAEGTDRRTALDLLAVDALVTHAMELMAENPEEFEARCLAALRTLSTIPATT